MSTQEQPEKSKTKGEILFERLKDSPLLKEFHRAFRNSTGLPLRVVGPDSAEWLLGGVDENRSPFCVELNSCRSACDACRSVNSALLKTAEVEGPVSCKCFTGMSSTAVPIKLGPQVIAYLKTGQVFTQVPTEANFQDTLAVLGKERLSSEDVAKLRKAYFDTRTLEPERFQSMVDLLIIFAKQLSALAEELAVATHETESDNIKRARHFIHQQLDQKLILAEIAKHAGMSPSHLSRSFREETGITVTEYIGRSRINWACRELGHPNNRVSDVAFLVGFQSLSQFNRAFLKFVGKSPTEYRNEKFEGLIS